jgi:hypothetical protein
LHFETVVSSILGEIEEHLRRDLVTRKKSSSLSHEIAGSAASGAADGRKLPEFSLFTKINEL